MALESPRFYPAPSGAYLPSVTTILALKAKPVLIPWAAKVEREAAADALAELCRAGYFAGAPGPTEDLGVREAYAVKAREELLAGTKAMKAVNKVKTEAANVGKLVHARAEAEMKGHPLPELVMRGLSGAPDEALTAQAEQAWKAYSDWKAQAGLEDPVTEVKIIDQEERYAGTADLIARDNHGQLALWDYKTSKRADLKVPRGDPRAVYEEYHMQEAAYAAGARKMGYPIETCYCIRLPKSPEDGFEVVEIDDFERRLRGFLAFRDAWWECYPDEAEKARQKGRKED